ncbi:MAG TPA: low molecular weight phosphatase family protein [Candidatus Competibacter sp.]|nr:low molecular weight phosphatase family protein [Candidatus Competibacter sp.]
MKRILFLCTGNYYRSRFCEEYFNHGAGLRGLAWRGELRGVAPPGSRFCHPRPLSPASPGALRDRGVALDGNLRYPLAAHSADLARADRTIALSRREHEPMVESFFPAYGRAIEYWEVGDVEIESPASAIEKMVELTDQLLGGIG